MVRQAASLLVITLAGACARKPVVVAPVALECPKPPQVARPVLPIQTIPPGATPDVVATAWADSVAILAGYAQQLEIILYGHTLPPASDDHGN